MQYFEYKYIDTNGNKQKSTIEAIDIITAKNKLILEDNYNLIDIKKINKIKEKIKYKKIDKKYLSEFAESLSVYLNSGINLSKAIKLLSLQKTNKKNKKEFLIKLNELINEGNSLHNSLSEQKIYIIPDFFTNSIKISEENGFLENNLLELSLFLKEQEIINKQIKSALFYPSFIFLTSLLMIYTMMTMVIPKISSVFSDMGKELPKLTQIVIDISNFLTNNSFYIITSILIMVFSYIYFYRKSEKFKNTIDRIILKIPLIGDIIKKSEIAKFSYMLSVLNKSGVPLVKSVSLSKEIILNNILKEIFSSSSEEINKGKNLSSILKNKNKNNVIPEDFINAIEISEETSELTKMLSKISEIYIQDNKYKIGTLLSLLEPIMMLFIGSSVGIMVAAMLLPIFTINLG